MDTTNTTGLTGQGQAAATATLLNDEGPGHDTGAFKNEQESTDTALCPADAVARKAAKGDATLIAAAALAGVELVKLADGSWTATKWTMVKHLATMEQAMAWLVRFTGAAA